jgi:hypothetical protein
MPRSLVAGVMVATLVLAPTQTVFAQSAQGCQGGQTPQFTFGFADLKAQLGETMGDPLTCAFTDPTGSGDIEQRTTTGLAFWRRSTNTPTFTDGFNHWAETPDGWVNWTGASVDPPVANTYPDVLVEGFLTGCERTDPNNQLLQGACQCSIDRIQVNYPVDEFLSVAGQLLQGGSLPPDYQAIVEDCVQRQFT